MKKLLAVDGNSIINRAFYGIRLLDNGKGVYTNAIFGMINILQKNMDAVKPDYCVVAFDLKAPTFRHEMYPEYKAGRHKMPEELAMQFPYAKQVLSAMGFNILEKEGYEADDILGTVARLGSQNGCESYILTGDRDSLQLIGEDTTVLLAKTNETLFVTPEKLRELYSVSVEQFVDLKALMGDSSDNIPGVPGVGEKTAAKLLGEFGSLDFLYENYLSSGLTQGMKDKLTAGKDSAFLSRTLATINCDVPLDKTIEDLRYDGMDKPAAYDIFRELGFYKFIERYGLTPSDAVSTEEGKTSSVAEYEKAYLSDAPVGEYCVSFDNGYLYSFDGKTLYSSDNAEEIKAFLSSNKVACADSKALYTALETIGIRYREASFDCVLAAYVINSNTEYTVEKVFDMYGAAPSETEAVRTFSILSDLKKSLSDVSGERILYDVELPVAAILCDMERTGFLLDVAGLRGYGNTLSEELAGIEEQIYFHAGKKFNINSPKQLGEVLFEEMGLPAQKKTKTGYSTSAEILEKIKLYHPIVPLILDYRMLGKLIGTYVEGLISAADDNGKVHTVFKQAATATGRLSSAEPNLQNIPIKTELGKYLRKFFLPSEEGYVLIDADYSQIELRLLAHIADDEHMIDAFNSGADIHTATAAKVFGVPRESVTPLLRKRAKAVNFGIMYGMGEFSLAGDLGISMKEAKGYIESYFSKYPKITDYFERTKSEAYDQGYVTTLLGRRRYIPELSASNKNIRMFGERVARNSPIQGSAADIMKLAMINVDRRFREECPEARILLQVHDELLVEAPKSKCELAMKLLREEMENAVSLSVQTSVECSSGETWYDCK